MLKSKILFAAMLLTLVICAPLRAEEVKSTVNIVLADGTIMMYSGASAGINEGDEFEVTRGGDVVGHVRIIKVKDLFSYAELVDGDVKEMDQVTRTKEAAASSSKKSSDDKKTEKAEKKEKKEEKEKKEKKEKKTKDKDKKAKTSKRRDDAKEETSDSDKDSEKSTKSPTKRSEMKDEDKKEKISDKAADKKKEKTSQFPPLGGNGTTSLGLSGLFFVPTANTKPDKSISFNVMSASADMDNYDFTHLGYGLTFGLSGNMELAYTMLNTEYSLFSGASTLELDSNVFSFKYQLKNITVPSFMTGNVTEARYAVGLQYYSRDDSSSSTGVDNNATVTRFYGVATMKYSLGTGHVGVFYQSGDLVDDSDYDGFGFTGGVEYPIGGKGGLTDAMSLIAEYDSKAFYNITYQQPSIGIRYYLPQRGHVTLGLVDVTDVSMLLLHGAYDFR